MKKCKSGYVKKGNKCVKSYPVKIFKSGSSASKFFLWATIIMVAISSLIGASFLLFGSFNETTLKILFTSFTLGGVSLLGLICGTSKNDILKYSGIGLSAITGLFWLILIWGELGDRTGLLRTIAVMTTLSVAIAHVILISPAFRSSNNAVRIAFWITSGLVIAVAGVIIYPIIRNDFFENLGLNYWRIFGFLAILDVGGSIITPILNKVKG